MTLKMHIQAVLVKWWIYSLTL